MLFHALLDSLQLAGVLFEDLLLLFAFGLQLCQQLRVLKFQPVFVVEYAAKIRADPLVVFVLCIPEFALQVDI